MGIVYLIIVVIGVIISIISIISHTQSKNKLKSKHAETILNLKPHRTLSSSEISRINEVYKLTLPLSTQVYKHRGSVGCISLSFNHAEEKQYNIGSIMIAPFCHTKLAKKEANLDLDQFITNPNIIKGKHEEIRRRFERGAESEKELTLELEKFYEVNCYIDFEFFFLKENNLHKQSAIIISLNNKQI